MEDTKKVQEELTEPLFTGDYTRDTAVSEYEKVAEVSTFLWGIIPSNWNFIFSIYSFYFFS